MMSKEPGKKKNLWIRLIQWIAKGNQKAAQKGLLCRS